MINLDVNYLLDERGRCGEGAGRVAEGEHHPLDLGAAIVVVVNFNFQYKL